MSPREQIRALAWLRTIASCASRAANASGRDQDFARLRDVITTQERQHRRSFSVTKGAFARRFTLSAAADYFVIRTLRDGIKLTSKPVSALLGLREDYLRGAILMSCPRFREAFEAEIHATLPNAGVTLSLAIESIDDIDYCDLIGGN